MITLNEKDKYNREYYYQLSQLCKLMDLKLQKCHNILVHCKHGKYRSTCLVIAYLMYKSGIKLEPLYEMMMTKYPLVKLKKHIFCDALKMFEKDDLNDKLDSLSQKELNKMRARYIYKDISVGELVNDYKNLCCYEDIIKRFKKF